MVARAEAGRFLSLIPYTLVVNERQPGQIVSIVEPSHCFFYIVKTLGGLKPAHHISEVLPSDSGESSRVVGGFRW